MLKTGVNIIKSSDVKVEGEFQLDIDLPTDRPRSVSRDAAIPQVRIVENHEEYALIEFTCACGNKTCIECRYDRTQSGSIDKARTTKCRTKRTIYCILFSRHSC